MELYSVIAGLNALKQEHLLVTIFSDSRYVVDMFMGGYARKWKAHGWRRGRQPSLNSDLWDMLLNLCDKHTVNFQWVKGHSEHPENTRCDELAVEARRSEHLPADECYENIAVKPHQLTLM